LSWFADDSTMNLGTILVVILLIVLVVWLVG
jgi:hypothetical protein